MGKGRIKCILAGRSRWDETHILNLHAISPGFLSLVRQKLSVTDIQAALKSRLPLALIMLAHGASCVYGCIPVAVPRACSEHCFNTCFFQLCLSALRMHCKTSQTCTGVKGSISTANQRPCQPLQILKKYVFCRCMSCVWTAFAVQHAHGHFKDLVLIFFAYAHMLIRDTQGA